MSGNLRPESMQRITNFELANAFIDEQIALVRQQVGDKKVLLALSGGVDSSVVAALLIKAIGKQLVCVHVNHGLMRKDESENVIRLFKGELDANLIYVDATDRFLDLLAGVADGHERVHGFARLGDGHDQRARGENRVAVAEFVRERHFDRNDDVAASSDFYAI